MAVVDREAGEVVFGPETDRGHGEFDVASGAAVVADGTSGFGERDRGFFADDPHESGGQWYAETFVGAFASALTESDDLTEACADAIRTAAEGLVERAPDDADESVSNGVKAYELPNAKGSALVWDTNEGWVKSLVLGDTSIVTLAADGEAEHAQAAGNLPAIDERSARLRAEAREDGYDADEAREIQLDHVRRTRAYCNSPGGYWVARANPFAAQQAATAVRDIDNVLSVAAFTDGLDPTVETYDLFESYGDLAAATSEEGTDRIVDRLREREAAGEDTDKRVHSADDVGVANVDFDF